jgi:Transposase IS116/IS110/IS902 family
VAAKGREGLHQLVTVVTECGDERLPSNARFACQAIVTQLHAVQIEISGLDKRITQIHRTNADSKRLDTIPGFGVILSTAVVATMTDPKALRTGREFAAWIGLVPRQNSTGGKERLGSISKQGDRTVGSPTDQAGRGRAGQQDGADRLGGVGQGRALSGANTLKQRRHLSGGLNRWQWIARLRRGRRGKSRVMMV